MICAHTISFFKVIVPMALTIKMVKKASKIHECAKIRIAGRIQKLL